MFRFCSLYSGSSGNSYIVYTESTKLLIDAGVSAKKIEEALLSLSINPSEIDSIFITHEHQDHTKGLGTFAKKYNLKVYANEKTFEAMPTQKNKIKKGNINYIAIGDSITINDIKIHSFSVPHDAASPVGYNFYHDNKKISIALDIGHITENVKENLSNSVFALIESNYDPEVLRYSPYPFNLKTRINSPLGHLSNKNCGEVVSSLVDSGLKTVMLGHLSNNNNFPELALKTVSDEVENIYGNIPCEIIVANRDFPSKIIDIN